MGPALDVLPYTNMSGNVETGQYGMTGQKVTGSAGSFIKKVDGGFAFKAGLFLKIKKTHLVIETKVKYGFLNLLLENLDSGSYLHNVYLTANVGYVLK
jgi:hypothetical protein